MRNYKLTRVSVLGLALICISCSFIGPYNTYREYDFVVVETDSRVFEISLEPQGSNWNEELRTPQILGGPYQLSIVFFPEKRDIVSGKLSALKFIAKNTGLVLYENPEICDLNSQKIEKKHGAHQFYFFVRNIDIAYVDLIASFDYEFTALDSSRRTGAISDLVISRNEYSARLRKGVDIL